MKRVLTIGFLAAFILNGVVACSSAENAERRLDVKSADTQKNKTWRYVGGPKSTIPPVIE